MRLFASGFLVAWDLPNEGAFNGGLFDQEKAVDRREVLDLPRHRNASRDK